MDEYETDISSVKIQSFHGTMVFCDFATPEVCPFKQTEGPIFRCINPNAPSTGSRSVPVPGCITEQKRRGTHNVF